MESPVLREIMLKIISTLSLVLSVSAIAGSKFDKKESLHGVKLRSGKENTLRTYVGTTKKSLPFSIDLVKTGITNFNQKCNNAYKDKRKFTSQTEDCKYHNEHLIETFVVTDFRRTDYFSGFSEVYLLGRQIYNRGSFGHYELVTVQNSLNDKKQKVVTITLRMLDDKEAKLFTNIKFSRESAFDSSLISFTLTETSPETTHLSYEYRAETDHWLLNKEVSVPQVFASISRSVNELLSTVEKESSKLKRDLASKE